MTKILRHNRTIMSITNRVHSVDVTLCINGTAAAPSVLETLNI